MKLRKKIILLALAPLVLVLCIIAVMLNHQAVELAREQRNVIEPAYLASKEGRRAQELPDAGAARHYPLFMIQAAWTRQRKRKRDPFLPVWIMGTAAIFLRTTCREPCSCTPAPPSGSE